MKDKKTITQGMEVMRKVKSLPKERQREMFKNLSKQEKMAFNEMNKQFGKIKSDEKRTSPRGGGGGGGGGAFTQFGTSSRKGVEQLRKKPFEFSRGGGVATQGTKFSRNG